MMSENNEAISKFEEMKRRRKRQKDILTSIQREKARHLKAVEKLDNEFDELTACISKVESECTHEYNPRKYVEATDSFERICKHCGKATHLSS